MGLPETIQLNEEYARTVEHQYQRMDSKLFGCVRTGTQAAVDSYENYIGPIEFHPIRTRNGPTVLQDVEHTRRRVTLTWHAAGIPLDRQDDFHSVTDLGGPYVQALRQGAARLVDDTIYSGLGAIAYTGQKGATAVNVYDAGESRLIESNATPVTEGSDFSNQTATVLTVAKLGIINGFFTNAKVPSDNRYLLINEYNKGQLMTDTTLSDLEKVALRDIKEGDVPRVLGLNLIIMPDDFFTVNATDVECIECYAWQREAVMFKSGVGQMMPNIFYGPRPDLNYTKQFWADCNVGSTRLRGPGVVKILLKKSA
jgi:hypothetical protein